MIIGKEEKSKWAIKTLLHIEGVKENIKIWLNPNDEFDGEGIVIGNLSKGKAKKFFDSEIVGKTQENWCKILINCRHPVFEKYKVKHILIPHTRRIKVKFKGNCDTFLYYDNYPLLIQKEKRCWITFDLGISLYSLLHETYTKNTPSLADSYFFQRFYYETGYYLMPFLFKIFFRKKKSPMNFPIDFKGYFLKELFTICLKWLNIKRAPYWPMNYKWAFVLCIDIEPSPLTFKTAKRIFKKLEKAKIKYNVSIPFKILKDILRITDLKGEVICHGDNHSGYLIFRKDLIDLLKKIKSSYFNFIDVKGFRSPRFARNIYLHKTLKEAGFDFSSSFPDVDYERPSDFGAGISFNFPFFNEGILEIPPTAPDCITPLYLGYSLNQLFKLYEEKINFVRDIGGVFVCTIHPEFIRGMDIRLRENLLDFILSKILNDSSVWITTFSEIYKWWKKR